MHNKQFLEKVANYLSGDVVQANTYAMIVFPNERFIIENKMTVQEGITLQQAACLAQCNASKVELNLSGTFTYEDFRTAVLEATASDTEHLIVSYSRKAFMQTGDGHFSPVGGFHPGRDLVLILDTARFKYPPHWVPLRMLYGAMADIDKVTGAALSNGSVQFLPGFVAGILKCRNRCFYLWPVCPPPIGSSSACFSAPWLTLTKS